MSLGWARIVVFIAPQDAYAAAYREVIEHAGLRAEFVEQFTPSELNRTHVVLLCGHGRMNATQSEALHDWVMQGGSLVCSGSAWGLQPLLGLQGEPTIRANSTLKRSREDRLWPKGLDHFRFFGGATLTPGICERIAETPEGQAGVSRRILGQGVALFAGAHLGQTWIQAQLGRSVECDAIGPEDGSAELADGRLRAEDGIPYSWSDRTEVSGGPIFGTAHSDVAKEVWLRAVFEAIERSHQVVATPWYWPHHAHAGGLLSLDCEDDNVEHVVAVHRALSMYGVPASWNVKLPGYATEVYRTLRAREHEISLLYSDEGADWHEERLRSQMTQLTRMASEHSLNAVRPADGGWRGWTKFYELCEGAGARASLSKGGRKPGTQGFAFGTCHPFYAPRRDGSPGLVLEIPYSLYRPGVVASDAVVDACLKETIARNGCLHLVASPESFVDRVSLDSIRRCLTNAKQEGVKFLLAGEWARWEKARRQLRWHSKNIGGELQLTLISETEMSGFSLLVAGRFRSATVNSKAISMRPLERFGCEFTALEFDLPGRMQVDLKLVSLAAAEAA